VHPACTRQRRGARADSIRPEAQVSRNPLPGVAPRGGGCWHQSQMRNPGAPQDCWVQRLHPDRRCWYGRIDERMSPLHKHSSLESCQPHRTQVMGALEGGTLAAWRRVTQDLSVATWAHSSSSLQGFVCRPAAKRTGWAPNAPQPRSSDERIQAQRLWSRAHLHQRQPTQATTGGRGGGWLRSGQADGARRSPPAREADSLSELLRGCTLLQCSSCALLPRPAERIYFEGQVSASRLQLYTVPGGRLASRSFLAKNSSSRKVCEGCHDCTSACA